MNDLQELAYRVLQVTRRSGPNDVMAVCPFHTDLRQVDGRERAGSLGFSTETGLWVCHQCDARGSLPTLLRKLGHPPDEIDELLLLAKPVIRDHRFALHLGLTENPLPEALLGFFSNRRDLPAQMLEWGFLPETIRAFDVGYDPKHVRITFPLRNAVGRLIGVSGRALGNHPARYKVYSAREYEAWGLPPYAGAEKSQVVWNYENVSANLRYRYDAPVLVTEGFKACMWLWQLGFRDVVALLGSAMSEVQQALLERLGGVQYLFLDNDGAGQKKYGIAERLAQAGVDVCIPAYEGTQPDQLKTREAVLVSMKTAPVWVPKNIQERDKKHGLW